MALAMLPSQFAKADGSSGPDIPTYGYYVTWVCPDGTIEISGTTVCSDQTIQRLECVSNCTIYVTGSDSADYQFAGWSSSGIASISGSGQSVGIVLVVPHPLPRTDYYGTVTYINGLSATLTAETFVNWSTPWSDGRVQVCSTNPYGPCATRSTGDSNLGEMHVAEGFTYALTGVDFPTNWYVHQWNTTMGSLSSLTTDPTTLYVGCTCSGYVSMYAASTATTTWAGDIFSPGSTSTTGDVFQTSGTFVVPNATVGGYTAVWAGIGGISSALGLWQAGVWVPVAGGGPPQMWYEEVGTGCSPCTAQFSSATVAVGDQVTIAVTSNGFYDSFWVNDTTQHTQDTLSDQSFSPYMQSGEWIDEAPLSRGYYAPFTYCTELKVNAQFVTLQNNYLVARETADPTVSLLELWAGIPSFFMGPGN